MAWTSLAGCLVLVLGLAALGLRAVKRADSITPSLGYRGECDVHVTERREHARHETSDSSRIWPLLSPICSTGTPN